MNAKLNLPRAVATDRFGNLYIAEAGNNTVRRVSAAGEISTFAGDGFSGYRGDGGYAAGARLKQPGGLALNEAGELYIADSGNGVVRKVSISGVIATVTDGLSVPRGLAFDARGALYIAESGGNRVRRIDTTGNVSMADSGCETPRGIAVDRDGTLYVSEAGKHRIRRVVSASAFEVLAGNGDAGFAGDGGPATLAQLSYPDGLLLTAKGDLLVADSGNHRIRKLTPGGPAVVPPAVQAPPVAEPVRVQFSLVHAALNRETPVAAGMLVTLYTSFELNPAGKLLFDGVAAKIVSRTANQWNAVVPDSVTGKTSLTMEISDGTLVQAKRLVEIVPAMPGLFSAPGEVLHVLALHDNGTLNSITNPVPRNSIATIFATGLDGKASIGVTLAGRELLLSEPAVTMDGVTTIRFRVPGAYVGSGDQALSIKTGEARSLELNLRIE